MNRVRKHIPLVPVAFVFAANGKRLTRRPARNQINAIFPFLKLHASNILVEKMEVSAHRTMPVFRKGIAAIFVPFDYGNWFESGLVQSKRKPATPSK